MIFSLLNLACNYCEVLINDFFIIIIIIIIIIWLCHSGCLWSIPYQQLLQANPAINRASDVCLFTCWFQQCQACYVPTIIIIIMVVNQTKKEGFSPIIIIILNIIAPINHWESIVLYFVFTQLKGNRIIRGNCVIKHFDCTSRIALNYMHADLNKGHIIIFIVNSFSLLVNLTTACGEKCG